LSNTSSKLGRAILTTPVWIRVKLTVDYFLCDFSGVIDHDKTIYINIYIINLYDPAEISNPPFGSAIFLKMEYPAKLIPYLNLLKKLGIVHFIFGFSGVINLTGTDFDDFRSDYLGDSKAICEMVSPC
jgi:hypothetical protein